MNELTKIQKKIEFWSMYVDQHDKTYRNRNMPKAWYMRIAAINDKILQWRLDEVEVIKKKPYLYRRKMTLIENLFYQVEYHQCEKERIIRKHYETEQELDYGMVLHHQREALLLSEELHFELLKHGMQGRRIVLNNAYEM